MPLKISLREMDDADLPIFFAQQLDEAANRMAAFTAKEPSSYAAFLAHWTKVRADARITIRTVMAGGPVAGYVLSHPWFGAPEVSFWLGQEFWGQGIATQALADFLRIVTTRPLFARAASDNLASRRVLAKCGFALIGVESSFANARQAVIEEVIMRLDAGGR